MLLQVALDLRRANLRRSVSPPAHLSIKLGAIPEAIFSSRKLSLSLGLMSAATAHLAAIKLAGARADSTPTAV